MNKEAPERPGGHTHLMTIKALLAFALHRERDMPIEMSNRIMEYFGERLALAG